MLFLLSVCQDFPQQKYLTISSYGCECYWRHLPREIEEKKDPCSFFLFTALFHESAELSSEKTLQNTAAAIFIFQMSRKTGKIYFY